MSNYFIGDRIIRVKDVKVFSFLSHQFNTQFTSIQGELILSSPTSNGIFPSSLPSSIYWLLTLPSVTQPVTILNITTEKLFDACSFVFPSTRKLASSSNESDEESGDDEKVKEINNQNAERIEKDTESQASSHSNWKLLFNNTSTSNNSKTVDFHFLPLEIVKNISSTECCILMTTLAQVSDSALTFSLSYQHPLIHDFSSPQSTVLYIPPISSFLPDSSYIDLTTDRYFDSCIYSINTNRNDGGKDPAQQLHNMKMRHASGSKVTLIEPTISLDQFTQHIISLLNKNDDERIKENKIMNSTLDNESSLDSKAVDWSTIVAKNIRYRRIVGQHSSSGIYLQVEK